jgi:hypothetical protein
VLKLPAASTPMEGSLGGGARGRGWRAAAVLPGLPLWTREAIASVLLLRESLKWALLLSALMVKVAVPVSGVSRQG